MKGQNGYYVSIAGGKTSYFNPQGKEISASEFKAKCPTIYKHAQARTIKGQNGYYALKNGNDDVFSYYNPQGQKISASDFKAKCPTIYKQSTAHITKGQNGYYAVKHGSSYNYYNPQGQKISAKDFKAKCPTIYEQSLASEWNTKHPNQKVSYSNGKFTTTCHFPDGTKMDVSGSNMAELKSNVEKQRKQHLTPTKTASQVQWQNSNAYASIGRAMNH